jgi:hypothetical protein
MLNVAANGKHVDAYETNAHYRRILVTPLRTNEVTFDVYFYFFIVIIYCKKLLYFQQY